MKKFFQIAIDGPIGAGKGTVSKKVAKKLHLLYIDTGAMYRVATWLALKNHIPIDNQQSIAQLVKQAQISLSWISEKKPVQVFVNGQEVTKAIRRKEIDRYVAQISALPQIRQELVKKQQQLAQANDVIMEGRDIASVVLPHADLKIYLDASEDIRIKRRLNQLIEQGKKPNYEGVAQRIRQRDTLDKTRKTNPLEKAADAWYLDTSDLSVNEVVNKIIKRFNQIRSKKSK